MAREEFNRTAQRRWERFADRPLLLRSGAGARIGFLMGALFSGVAIAVALGQRSMVLQFRHGHSVPLSAVLASYLIAGPLTGALFGALFRGTRSVGGSYAVGLIAALPIIASVVSSIAGVGPWAWDAQQWLTAIILLATLGGIGGTIVRQMAAT